MSYKRASPTAADYVAAFRSNSASLVACSATITAYSASTAACKASSSAFPASLSAFRLEFAKNQASSADSVAYFKFFSARWNSCSACFNAKVHLHFEKWILITLQWRTALHKQQTIKGLSLMKRSLIVAHVWSTVSSQLASEKTSKGVKLASIFEFDLRAFSCYSWNLECCLLSRFLGTAIGSTSSLVGGRLISVLTPLSMRLYWYREDL